MNEKDLIKLDDVKSIMQLLQQPTLKVAEALTGILVSELKDWKLSAGRILQSVIAGNLLTQLGREIEKYRKDGKIKENFLENDINRASLKKLLKFIDEEAPDEIRFRAMKSIFFSSVDGGDDALAYEFMQICSGLSSMEILILSANYNIAKGMAKPRNEGIQNSNIDINYWAQIVAEQVGHNLPEIILQYENHLMELRLISSHHYYVDTTRVTNNFAPTPYFRLTALGYRLCEFIIKYE